MDYSAISFWIFTITLSYTAKNSIEIDISDFPAKLELLNSMKKPCTDAWTIYLDSADKCRFNTRSFNFTAKKCPDSSVGRAED
ncbi:MAG: hypothetical protein CL691_04260 [Cellvibrionales bacterium]|nr:hypothetical protein [Cellvibrionales bacterium]|tara:strand:- start:7967 stop:8215 length:249 start_codon:yes stop_codon:yes gene_type:complete